MRLEARRFTPKIAEDEIDAYEPEAWRVSLFQKISAGKPWKRTFGSFRLNPDKVSLEDLATQKGLLLSCQNYQALWLLGRARLLKAPLTSEEIGNFISELGNQAEDVLNLENLISVKISELRGSLAAFTDGALSISSKHGYGYSLALPGEGDERRYKGSKGAHDKARIVDISSRRY
jgi:hypothetical protein